MSELLKYLPGTSSSLPPLGQDFLDFAKYHEIPQDVLVANLLFVANVPPIPLSVVSGVKQQFDWVSGHGINTPGPDQRGPRKPYEVAIVGKCLGPQEARSRRLFAGKTGFLLNRFLAVAGLDTYADIYLTNLLKTQPLKPGKWQVSWAKAQSVLLMIELWMTRPKFVMALGKEVCKFFLGRDEKMADIEGRWFDVAWDLRDDAEQERTSQNYYEFKLLPCMHPAALEYESKPEDANRIQDTFHILAAAINGGSTSTQQKLIEYPVVRDIETLKQWYAQIPAETTLDLVAMDAEWQGKHPQNAGSYMRCFQLGWAPNRAIVVHLTDTTGKPDFLGSNGQRDIASRQEAFDATMAMFREHSLRVAGFFFPADLEWMTYFGLDISPWYAPADSMEECRTKGGFALELAVAAVDELSRNDLDSVRWRYTNYPPYEHVLKMHVKTTQSDASKKKDTEEDVEYAEMVKEGYGWIPDEILYPYAGADVDVTIRAVMALIKAMDADRFGNSCWLPYFTALGASLTVAEIMQVGLPFDSKCCLELSKPYARLFYKMIDDFRRLLNWPDWNPDSSQQVVESMYGVKYSTKRVDGRRVSVRPPGAMTLGLVPVLNNDSKSPQLWTKIVESGQVETNTPGTSGKTIGVLCGDPAGVMVRRCDPVDGLFKDVRVPTVPGLTTIRDIRTLGQLRKTFLGKWEGDRIAEEARRGLKSKSKTKPTYSGGLSPQVCDDGYIRAFISQVKETGRWSASRPNLHALPKRKEAWYQRIMKDEYPGSVRSMFSAPPGYVIIESDYKTAELFMLALAADDRRLWQHCQDSLLPEDHPNYMDIHSNVAVSGLKLTCAPTKRGLKSIDRVYLRDVAKCYAIGEMIGTASGWVPIETLVSLYGGGQRSAAVAPGECMLQSDVGKTPLLAVHRAGVKECFSVKTTLGYELRVSADHETFVLRDGDVVKCKTSELRTTDHCLLVPRQLEDGSGRPLVVPKELRQAVQAELGVVPDVVSAKLLGLLAAINQFSTVERSSGVAAIQFPDGMPPSRKQLVASLLMPPDTPPAISRCGKYLSLFGGTAAILSQVVKSQWHGVPAVVFMWSEACRQAFAEGFLLYASRGSKRWPCLAMTARVADDEAEQTPRAMQQLLLSLGLLSKRVNGKLESYTQETLDWWQGAANNGEGVIKRGGHLSDRIPGVARRLCEQVGVVDRECLFSSRAVATERLAMVRNKVGSRDYTGVDFAGRIHSFLYSQVGFDKIESITSIGEMETFDVQTSKERQHAVVAGGILSSNSIVFGWAYGRQPPAIVIGAKEEGIIIELSDAEAVVNSLYELYPDAAAYLEEASARVKTGFLCTPMGRWRRCPDSQDRKTLSAYEREFKNAPIQGGVADVVNIAARRFREVRAETGVRFWIANQVHDAFIFLVPYDQVKPMVEYVIPQAMSVRVPIVPRRLDGSLMRGVEPKHMQCDMAPYFRWGVEPEDDELLGVGINPSWFK